VSLCVSTLFALSLLACGDDESSGGGGSGSQGGDNQGAGSQGGENEGAGSQGGDNAGGSGGAPAANAQVRVAHLSPDAPDVDFCLVPEGGDPVGPVLQSVGVNDGLAYPGVTGYLPVAAGTYAVRLLGSDATSCDDDLGIPDFTGIAVSADTNYTVAATGMVTPAGNDEAFDLKAYVDSLEVAADKISVRFIHLSPDTPNVDVGLGSGEAFAALFSNVPYGSAGQVAGEDYLEAGPLADVTISARATGTTADALVIPGVDIPAGAVVTAFAIGNLDGDPADLQALVCVDNAATPTCSALP
jgi:hypothetical protein